PRRRSARQLPHQHQQTRFRNPLSHRLAAHTPAVSPSTFFVALPERLFITRSMALLLLPFRRLILPEALPSAQKARKRSKLSEQRAACRIAPWRLRTTRSISLQRINPKELIYEKPLNVTFGSHFSAAFCFAVLLVSVLPTGAEPIPS